MDYRDYGLVDYRLTEPTEENLTAVAKRTGKTTFRTQAHERKNSAWAHGTQLRLQRVRCVAQVVDLRLQPDDLHLMPGEVLRLRADTPRPRRQGNPTETFAIRTKRTVQPRHGLRWRRRSSSGGPARPAVRGCAPRPKLSSSLIPCRGPREESAHTRGPCPPRTPHYG